MSVLKVQPEDCVSFCVLLSAIATPTDHAHHGANAYRALHETLEFDNAIQKARDITSSDDTLIVVTADHGHTFTFAGYPEREVPIFGEFQRPRYEIRKIKHGKFVNRTSLQLTSLRFL